MFEYKTTFLKTERDGGVSFGAAPRTDPTSFALAEDGWQVIAAMTGTPYSPPVLVWQREIVPEKTWLERRNEACAAHWLEMLAGHTKVSMTEFGSKWRAENPPPAGEPEPPLTNVCTDAQINEDILGPDPVMQAKTYGDVLANLIKKGDVELDLSGVEMPETPTPEAIVQAQVEGEPIPAPEPEIPEVVASWVGAGLENALIAAINVFAGNGKGLQWRDLLPSVQQDMRNLATALENDTYLLMTCDQECTNEPIANVNAHIETVNPDVVTTVSKRENRLEGLGDAAVMFGKTLLNRRTVPLDVRAMPKPEFDIPAAGYAPEWAAGWQIIGRDQHEFRVEGNYSHCCQELVEALNHVTGPHTASAQQVVINLRRHGAMRATTYDGDVLAWIKPL